ncbi:hypothetical protein ROA7450_01131 [Roseovarius albus]|uniref:HEPN AbiU2-like domain-containing protein n=1 Tax=Roseovarius albus TaxID=1247867 RepID=A0A1X6YS55_9RHOB|nr:hypothetical protein [Roseovarius albus]SLN27771.1 hypothetical protein ROA7450_01131 [Roseovarius albus]
MHKEKSLKEIHKVSPQERWQLACKKLRGEDSTGAVSSLLQHMREHENTQWVVYTSQLSGQLPRSYAAHAFSQLQNTLLEYEIVRLCTFWDPIDLDSQSIPTIVALADCQGVSNCVYEDHFSHYASFDLSLAKNWSAKARRQLRTGIRGAYSIEESDILKSVKNFRDKLAHQLEQTREEKRGAVPLPRYGDEKKLLRKTITVVNNLYLSLNATGFDWQGAKEINRRNAKAFWKGVTIQVKQ